MYARRSHFERGLWPKYQYKIHFIKNVLINYEDEVNDTNDISYEIQIGRMTRIDWRGWGRSGLGTFLGTMNHKFRFSTLGNPTKHMPIGYWSLWGQPRSVTSGDLSWPWNSYDAMSRVTSSHVLTPFTSTIPIQVNRTTPSCVFSRFRWNLVGGCSSYDVITSWPNQTWPMFFTKNCGKDSP